MAGLLGSTKVPNDRLIGTFDHLSWILDTGASRHVTGNITWLYDLVTLSSPCPVGLPNGTIVIATQKGLVRLSSHIVLSHVLYVPSLNCNLVYISQLTDHLHCLVHFDLHTCVIQDQWKSGLEWVLEGIDFTSLEWMRFILSQFIIFLPLLLFGINAWVIL